MLIQEQSALHTSIRLVIANFFFVLVHYPQTKTLRKVQIKSRFGRQNRVVRPWINFFVRIMITQKQPASLTSIRLIISDFFLFSWTFLKLKKDFEDSNKMCRFGRQNRVVRPWINFFVRIMITQKQPVSHTSIRMIISDFFLFSWTFLKLKKDFEDSKKMSRLGRQKCVVRPWINFFVRIMITQKQPASHTSIRLVISDFFYLP